MDLEMGCVHVTEIAVTIVNGGFVEAIISIKNPKVEIFCQDSGPQ